ncbi:DUF6931 family protein [Methylocella sp.]|uniref:DUF6931 family protein n=1 Tax=Methylocella sp. TaxID=1978226 RepID=UPI00378484E2
MNAAVRLRFATAQDLYEAYPTARIDVGAPADARGSLDFARALAGAGELKGALSFCAYLLSRFDAVLWACACLRRDAMSGASPAEAAALAAAEAWTREPDETRRRRALDLAERADVKSPATWAAFAAGRAGGQIAVDEKHLVPMPLYATAQAARISLILAGARAGFAARDDLMRGWIEAGLARAAAD